MLTTLQKDTVIAKHQRIQSQTTYSQVLPVAGAVILLLNKALLACSFLKEKKRKKRLQCRIWKDAWKIRHPSLQYTREEEHRPGKTPF